MIHLEQIVLGVDEYEAIRLARPICTTPRYVPPGDKYIPLLKERECGGCCQFALFVLL